MRDRSTELLVEKVVKELTRLRKEQGMSHQTLADKTGISRAGISYIESGKRDPKLSTCLKIAKALGVNLDDLIKSNRK